MSTTTDVLSLFKYDPVADADSTFNITQGLNNNWDKIDTALLLAIAAAGAYNPEESYAVGDYCTYKGKLHKCSTAIPTGETWTEAHWTTTTVAAEMQELSSQLSNKVDKIAPEKHELQVLDNWKTSTFSPSTYGKTQESIVFVEFRLSPIENMGIGVHDFAMLPEGFRPKNDTYFLIASQSMFINAWVKSSGQIRLILSDELGKEDEIKGLVSFIAEN